MPQRPFYLMLKPPIDTARAIVCQRRLLGIDSPYEAERLHMTILPLGDAFSFDGLDRAFSIDATPFELCLDMLDGTALIGSKPSPLLRTLQRAVVQCVIASGLAPPPYGFRRPHVTLVYGDAPPQPKRAIEPIRWWVDEVLLIRSCKGHHDLLGQWPLVARQHAFAFG